MRYLKITLSGAALFLIYLWVTIMMNSCNNAKPTIDTSADDVEMLEEEMEGTDFTEQEFEGDDDGGINYNSEEQDQTIDVEEDNNEENDDYVAGDYTASSEKTALKPRKKPKQEKTKTFTSSSSSSSSNASAGNSSGEYMVIAGSYLLEENANKMIRKLKGMGYSNAEIIYFNQSQYHSICAGRYGNRSSAKQTASSLQTSGIDSYVHRKQN